MIDFSEHSGLFRFVSKQFCLFRLFRYRVRNTETNRNFFSGFTKQTETNAKQILFRFEETLLTGKQETKGKLYNTLSFLNQQCLGEHFSWLKNSVRFPFLKPKSTLYNIKTLVLLNSFCKLPGEIRQKIEFFSFYKTLLSKNEIDLFVTDFTN
jgi:hypothetical protein